MADDLPPFRPHLVGSARRPIGPTGPRPPRSVATGGSRLPLFILAALLLFLFVAPFTARRLTDWMWYREIGFERVFLTRVLAHWALWLVIGVGSFVVFQANARFALRGLVISPIPRWTAHAVGRAPRQPTWRGSRTSSRSPFPSCWPFSSR